MSFPDIHSCSQFAAENASLKKKLHRLRQQKEDIQKDLQQLKEEKKIEALLKTYVTTRDVYVQTEPPKAWLHGVSRKREEKSEHVHDMEKTNKLLTMHNQLMRRYEKEVKQNMTHVETLTEVNLKLADMEKKLRDEKDKVLGLERELIVARGPRSNFRMESVCDEDRLFREVVKERNKLHKQNKRLKSELKGLDEGFFDEIEDIKFAFQQSALLNQEYEKTLRKFCRQFGVPYPHPERTVNIDSH